MSDKCSIFNSFVLLVARVFFTPLFIIAGTQKIMNFQTTLAVMQTMHVPFPEFALSISIILELGGGLLVLIGLFTRFGAFMLFIFTIPVTYVFHGFWGQEGVDAVNNMHHFFKNVSMLGAALYIMTAGAGAISCDRLFRKKH